MPIEVESDEEEDKQFDMFFEDDDVNLKLFKVYEELDVGFEDDGPKIPMSPCLEDDEEMDLNNHAFLLMRRGTQSSS